MSTVQTDKNEKVIGVIAQVDEEIQSLSVKVKCRAGANGPASQVLAWPLLTRRTPSFS